jgi:vacuolar-type H+-ATPase subunit E/Vma4
VEIVNNGALLESQILEDARARARRLLEAADRECDQIRAQAEESLREELARADKAREERIATLRRELAASLPLDFRRTRLAFLQEALATALAAWFGGLSRAEVDRLVSFRLARAGAAFADRTVVVQHAGMDEERARRIAAESLPGAIVDAAVAMEPDEAAAAGTGLVVACSDGSRRCRATVGEMKIQLLDEHREELITALYGKDALE